MQMQAVNSLWHKGKSILHHDVNRRKMFSEGRATFQVSPNSNRRIFTSSLKEGKTTYRTENIASSTIHVALEIPNHGVVIGGLEFTGAPPGKPTSVATQVILNTSNLEAMLSASAVPAHIRDNALSIMEEGEFDVIYSFQEIDVDRPGAGAGGSQLRLCITLGATATVVPEAFAQVVDSCRSTMPHLQ